MPVVKSKADTAHALVGIWTVVLTAFIIAALYFAREILIPLALAALLTFLLTPLVARLERWLGRVLAVVLVMLLIFLGAGLAGWVLTQQFVDLALKLPDYKENIRTKLHSLELPAGGGFLRISQTLNDLKKDLPGASAPSKPAAEGPQEGSKVVQTLGSPPTAVQIVESTNSHPLATLQAFLLPIVGPLGTAALVLLLLMFMLLKREDLRGRVIRLIGQGRISTTTRAMDDAGSRVSRYLLMQLVVNITYGVPVAVGLYFIGVPNAVLWGAFSAVLRFIPYVGPWIAASIPITLSLAVTPNWQMPLLTIGLFVVLELFSNNVMEPWLYGSSTGVSSMALIVAAIFWTWLWGPVGLVLATPLTVCLVVMGRHVPRLEFLSVLLSDEEALTPAEDFYHRLLTVSEQDELELVDLFLKTNTLSALYDSMFIPALTAAETDYRLKTLDQEQLDQVKQSMRDLIDDLGSRPAPRKGNAPPAELPNPPNPPETAPTAAGAKPRVYCLPARANRDEIAGAMLVQLLQQQGFDAQNAVHSSNPGEMLGAIEQAQPDVVCISVVAPSTIIHARYLCVKLRAALPQAKILVGIWAASENFAELSQRLKDSGADEVFANLDGVVAHLTA